MRPFRAGNERLLIGALLIAFAFRALIPQGFMPSADRPFTLQICPDGFPAHLLAAASDPHAAHADGHHHHHAAGSGDEAPAHQHSQFTSQHCVFAAAAGAALAPAFVTTIALSTGHVHLQPVPAVAIVASQTYRPQQARAPPLTLS
jgi:hypothetical protein